jgi:hypothetical protein
LIGVRTLLLGRQGIAAPSPGRRRARRESDTFHGLRDGDRPGFFTEAASLASLALMSPWLLWPTKLARTFFEKKSRVHEVLNKVYL